MREHVEVRTFLPHIAAGATIRVTLGQADFRSFPRGRYRVVGVVSNGGGENVRSHDNRMNIMRLWAFGGRSSPRKMSVIDLKMSAAKWQDIAYRGGWPILRHRRRQTLALRFPGEGPSRRCVLSLSSFISIHSSQIANPKAATALRRLEIPKRIHCRSQASLSVGHEWSCWGGTRKAGGEMGTALPDGRQRLAAKLGESVDNFWLPSRGKKMIYTTNAVEALHRQFRKVTKTNGSFPTDDALKKCST